MSDQLELGASDADARWIGIRRHQAVLVVSGIGLVGDWVVRPRAMVVEVIMGAALLLSALPLYDGMTVGEWLAVGARFRVRSRWTLVAVDLERGSLTLHAHGRAQLQGYELVHRGRLDLSGHDLQRSQELAAFADAVATSDRSTHLSVHVNTQRERASTLLTLPEGTSPPEGWAESRELLVEVIGVSATKRSMWLLERWRYLRTSNGLVRVLRVRDFTAVSHGQALLERLQQSSDQVSLGLHIDVISSQRAHRMAERAVRRTGSDSVVARSVGFRRTARADRCLERLAQREVLVASGRALLRVAVYVCVHAPSQSELHQRVSEVLRRGHEAGLRCERGFGRQATWFCHQLPGGPGW